MYVANFGDGSNSTVSVVDTKTWGVDTIKDPLVSYGTQDVATNREETELYVTVANSNNLVIFDVAATALKYTVRGIVPMGVWPMEVVQHPQRKTVYVVSQSGPCPCPDGPTDESKGCVMAVDTVNLKVVGGVVAGTCPTSIAFDPTGDRAYVVVSNGDDADECKAIDGVDGELLILNTAADDKIEVTKTVPLGEYPLGIAVTPDGRYVYVPQSAGSTVWVFNVEDGFDDPEKIPVGNDPIVFGDFVGQRD